MKGVNFMKEFFGTLPSGETASLYTISCGGITAAISDYGASLVRLLVPDQQGTVADVVLGYDDCNGYRQGGACLGATVGRSANRLKDASFTLGDRVYHLTANEGSNNLHSGPDAYYTRMWQVHDHTENSIRLTLHSPDGDQGYPGNAVIQVCYRLDTTGGLHITYDIRDLLNATIQLRDGKPLTDMNLGFKERMVMKKVLAKIKGTDIEKLLKEYHVIG